MKITKYLGLCGAVLMSSFTAQAQTHVTFDTQDYASIGVYDTWPESPFRTGALDGNVQVIDNHLADADTNGSTKILGFQRSRFGSNTFGARINLTTPWTTSTTLRYVHVLMNKPVEGRVMLIGLGKRTDRDDQSNDVEQFWVYPINDVKTDEWFDAVFPVKTNDGIEIHSLIVVPHCEAPHELSGDFIAYIDDVEMNDNVKPRVGVEDYMLNFTADTQHGRADERWTTSVGMTTSDGTQTIAIPTTPNKMAYNQLFDTPIKAKAGESVTPAMAYGSSWMHKYLYIDRDNDGQFSSEVDNNISLVSGTDLMSFGLYSNGSDTSAKNSLGTSISSSNDGFNVSTFPRFTIPSNLANGIYRMRYKLDWNNIDPGGDITSFVSNGGIIVDVLLNIHGDNVTVRQDNRNGEITLQNGTVIQNYSAPFGQALTIKMNPSTGFDYKGVRVRHGYNLSGDSLRHGNPQYRDVIIPFDEFDANDCVTIPAEYIDGDVLLEGLFVEQGTVATRPTVTYSLVCDGKEVATKSYKVDADADFPAHGFTSEASTDYYSISAIPDGKVVGDTTVVLTLTQNLPFKSSVDFEHAYWHNITICSDKRFLTSGSGSTISIGSSATTAPAEDDADSQWAFIGDVINGFKLVNKNTGDGKILSSTTNTSDGNTGGNTHPVMTSEPVPDGYNTYWIPTKSSDIAGENGFYLHQLGYTSNRINQRDNYLAYWTGGADGGSTLIATQLAGYALTIVAPATNQGTLEVFDGNTQLSNGSRVETGTVLTITPNPAQYYSVVEVKVNGSAIEAVDGVYTYTVGEEAVTVEAVFERDPNAPVDYCIPVYAGTGSDRTTTSGRRGGATFGVNTMTVGDGDSEITVEGTGQEANRAVYKDQTDKILVTAPGKTITIDITNSSAWQMYQFIYADYNLDGFGSDDFVCKSTNTVDQAANKKVTFTIPSDIKGGTYRIRYMLDWSNDNPCEFAQGQGDNCEMVVDFLIQIPAELTINKTGNGSVEVWSAVSDDVPAESAVQYETGATLPSSLEALYLFVKADADNHVESVTYDNGNGEQVDITNRLTLVATAGSYANWSLVRLDKPVSSCTVTVVFATGSTGIVGIDMDPADGSIHYYNMQGMEVKGENLLPGFYIVRQGSKVAKIFVK